MQKADGERRTGAHAAAGRQVAIVVQFDAAFKTEVAKGFADSGVGDLIDRRTVFDLPVDDAEAVFKEGGQVATGEVAVFIDGCGKHGTAVVPVPFWVIGSASEEGNPEGSAADDH